MVSLLERLDWDRPNGLAVLTYHRVDEPGAHPHLSPALVSATPDSFDEQMSHLAAHAHVVSAQDVIDVYQKGATLPPRAAMVTFDDACSDFAENAWPILKRYHLPVTLFVPTAFPDHPERTFWWDALHQALSSTARPHLDTPAGRFLLGTADQRRRAYKQLRDYVKSLDHDEAMAWVNRTCDELGVTPVQNIVLGWEALRQLAREGVTLGAHTQTHPLMNRVSPERARAEATGSLRDLEREIGPVLPILAYPGGGFDNQVVRGLEQDGFALAFTTVRGLNDLRGADRLRLRRINVGLRTPLAAIRVQLLPVMVHLNRWQTV